MFRFSSRKAEILNHWIAFVDSFNTSSSDFYAQVEQCLSEKKVPGMEVRRIDFSEGGLLSDKRTYLRLVRERLVFDICACPFGSGFFFSCRTAEIPAVPQVWEVLVLLIALYTLLYGAVQVAGILYGPPLLLCAVGLGAYVMRNAIALGLSDLDRVLIRTPAIGPVYEAYFRKETYYRTDTRLMYLDLVPQIVKVIAEELAAKNGLKLLRQYLHAPVLGSLYAPVAEEANPPSVPLPARAASAPGL
jgi:hypothetical protein